MTAFMSAAELGVASTCLLTSHQPECVQKRESLGLPPGDTDPFFDTVDDSEWQVLHAALEQVELVLCQL